MIKILYAQSKYTLLDYIFGKTEIAFSAHLPIESYNLGYKMLKTT